MCTNTWIGKSGNIPEAIFLSWEVGHVRSSNDSILFNICAFWALKEDVIQLITLF